MTATREPEHIQTVIIGGGQSGLALGYHLRRRDLPFIILDAHERVGDAWRKRWDSLRLFTPARLDGLPGLPYPASSHYFPTKDEFADYLEDYARHFDFPVRTGVRVQRVAREGDRFVVESADQRLTADNVVVAMAHYQVPWIPPVAADLDPGIRQLHAGEYLNPAQLQDGDVLIVGAGNSGAEIALDLAPRHRVWLSGRDVGHIPFRIEGLSGRLLMPIVGRVFFHRIAKITTPIGRRLREKMHHHGGPLVRTKPSDLAAAGVERVPRVAGVHDGLPRLDDGTVLDVANVVWCTGFRPDFGWIDLPAFDEEGEPAHERGVSDRVPGLYFMGLLFQYAASSTMIHGIDRDAAYVARAIAARVQDLPATPTAVEPVGSDGGWRSAAGS